MGLSPERARKRKGHGNSSDPPTVPEGELGVTAVTNGHGQPSRDKGRASEADFPPQKKKNGGKKGEKRHCWEQEWISATPLFCLVTAEHQEPPPALGRDFGLQLSPPTLKRPQVQLHGEHQPPPRGPRLAQDSLPHTPSCLCTPLGSASPPVLLFSCSAKP